MPQATCKFLFEFRILGWASNFSDTMTGENRGFLIVFSLDGAVERIFFGSFRCDFNLDLKRTITESAVSYFFYHPFEAPEYTFIEWKNLPRQTLERLMKEEFDQNDLTASGETIEFPTTWGVMF